MEQTQHRWLYFFIGLAVLVNFSGLFVPLMDPDAGVYASVSKNMVLRHDYLNLYFQGHDWLDKPHFPFWITALFFKVFGMHEWSYKLPGILFVMMGAFYTYLFTKKYYNKRIALVAVFFLLTAEHILISNNDVRAEPFLTGLLIASIYHFACSLEKKLSVHLVAACFFTACAMMTKGLFTLIPIGAAVAGELLIKEQWKQIFHWRWIIAVILIAIFISPELYSLWYQFDQHPDKTVFGRTNISGIKFFLWDSQFGRFMNTGPIKGKGDPFFFLHTLLWAFLPWAILMYAAFFVKIKKLVKRSQRNTGEWFSFSGSLLTLLVFSISKFQLPYYANIIFPLLAIMTVSFVWELPPKSIRLFSIIQNSIAFIIISLLFFLFFYYQPKQPSVMVIGLLILLVLLLFFLPYFMREKDVRTIAFLRSGLATLIGTIFFNLVFYPDLLKYQSGNQAADYINKTHPGSPVGIIDFYMPSGEFYLDRHMIRTDTASIRNGKFPKGGLLFLSEEEKDQLRSANIPFEVIREFKEFHITMLTLKFLNPALREKQLKARFLVRLL